MVNANRRIGDGINEGKILGISKDTVCNIIWFMSKMKQQNKKIVKRFSKIMGQFGEVYLVGSLPPKDILVGIACDKAILTLHLK